MSDLPKKRRIVYYPRPKEDLVEVTPVGVTLPETIPERLSEVKSFPQPLFPVLNMFVRAIMQILLARLEFWRSLASQRVPVSRGSIVLVKETEQGYIIIEKPLDTYSQVVSEE